MKIRFYSLLKDARLVDKTGTGDMVEVSINSVGESEMTGTFRKETDIIDPIIDVEMDGDYLGNFNYIRVEWPDHDSAVAYRYYFVIGKKVLRNGYVELTCHEDVLTTYRTPILASPAYVTRNESNSNPFIVDNKRIFTSKEILSLISNPSAPTTLNPTVTSTGALRYVITLSCATTATPYGGAYASDTWQVYPSSDNTGNNICCLSYAVDRTKLNAFMTEFLGLAAHQDIWTSFLGASTDSIISIKSFPFDLFDSSLIYSDSDYSMVIADKPLTTTGYIVRTPSYKIIDFGVFSIASSATDFRDFEPYKTAQLYLPYYGIIDIPMIYLMNSGVKIIYSVNCHTGDTVITVRSMANGSYVRTLTCNVAENVPITNTNSVEQARNAISASMSFVNGAAMLASGNPAGVTGMASSAFQIATNNLRMTGSLCDPNTLRLLRYTPYILLTTKEDVTPANYGHFIGYPCEKIVTLSSMSGYTEVGEIFLDLPKAQKNEADEIKQLLKNGVLI